MASGRKEGIKTPKKQIKNSTSLIRKIKNSYNSLRKENLPKLIFFVIIIVFLGGFFIYFVEKGKTVGGSEQMFGRFFDGLWWTVVTITSVGYGDKYPQTEIGKIFAIFLMLVGVIVTSILSGTVASIFVDKKIKEDRGLQNITTKNHIAICGWNNNAENILNGLSAIAKNDLEVVLISEIDSEQFQALKIKFPDMNLNFVRGDFTNEKVLRRGSLQNARAAIVLSDNSGSHTIANADERTILATLAIKSISADIITSAELINPENRQHLIRAKVDEILVNGEFNGFLLSSSAFSSGIPLLVKSILSFESKNIIKQVQVPSSFVGKPFKELLEHFFSTGKGIIIGFLCAEKKIQLDDLLSEESDAIDEFIKRKFMEAEVDLLEEEKEEGRILLNPDPGYLIRETDTAFVIGTSE
ncbi:MAG: NAD-binding protein [Spirochaetales bacterium]|nr:NAD-binding protein [Spirochaetales bacterium]